MAWLRLRPWLIVIGLTVCGAAAGLLAAASLPAWAAGIAGAACATIVALATAGAQNVLAARSARRNRSRELRAASAFGPRRRVRDIADPIGLGVHPAAPRLHTNGAVDQVPSFVVRDLYDEVVTRIRAGGFVLIVGDSTAGKSRIAYEALRAALPDHHFWRARPTYDMQAFLATVTAKRRSVAWFDELDQFLGMGGLTTEQLTSLFTRPRRNVVLVATMRSKEYDRFSARHKEATDAATWRAGRDILALAPDPITLDRTWTRSEVARARASGSDPRIAAAVGQAGTFGVAELLAAGPELVSDWKRAWHAGEHPRGAAIVAAAVDIRRMGLHRPVPRELLVELHHGYLDARGGSALRPEPIEEAFAWATTVAYATSSLLLPRDDGFVAFDYLIDQPLGAIPDASWRLLVQRSTPVDAYDIGWTAADLQRPDHAMRAFDRARDHVPGAGFAYLVAVGNAGNPQRAADAISALVAERTEQLGADHPDTLSAQHNFCRYLGESGHAAAAARKLAEVSTSRNEILGADHKDTLASRLLQARYTGEAGDPADAVRQLTAVAADRSRISGPDDVDTLLTLVELARFIGRSGDASDAVRRLTELRNHLERILGADNPYSLTTRYELGRWTGEAGQPAEAVRQLTNVLAEQKRVVTANHPRVLSTRHHLARYVGEAGDADRAVRELTELLPDRERVLGRFHHRTFATRRQLARWTGITGNTQEAVRLLDELHDDCLATLGETHPRTRDAAAERAHWLAKTSASQPPR